MTVIYDAAQLGTVRTLVRWRSTMLPMVLGQAPFWVLVVIHIVLHIIHRVAHPIPQLPWNAVNIVTSLLTFFIVFYGSQSYSRMQLFYSSCIGLGGTAMNWVALVRKYLHHDPNVQWNAVRTILAGMHIMYYTLNSSDGGASVSDSEWKAIVDRQLLVQEEVDVITTYNGYKPFLPIMWALDEVEHGLLSSKAPARADTAELLRGFRELALAFRGHCGQINNWMLQPVPFPYFHILTVVLHLDLMLISYSLVSNSEIEVEEGDDEAVIAFLASLLIVIPYAVVCLIFLGLREVAVAMSDPFGTDDVDFDLEAMLMSSYKNAVACLCDGRRAHGTTLAKGMSNPVIDKGGVDLGSMLKATAASETVVSKVITGHTRRRRRKKLQLKTVFQIPRAKAHTEPDEVPIDASSIEPIDADAEPDGLPEGNLDSMSQISPTPITKSAIAADAGGVEVYDTQVQVVKRLMTVNYPPVEAGATDKDAACCGAQAAPTVPASLEPMHDVVTQTVMSESPAPASSADAGAWA